MTQRATIIKILPGGMAEVSVQRTSACGPSCASCGASCAFKKSLTVQAENSLCASAGDAVLIETKSSGVFLAAAAVYIFPMLLFLATYFITAAAGAGETASILSSVGALALGIALACVYDRKIKRKKSLKYRITAFALEEEP